MKAASAVVLLVAGVGLLVATGLLWREMRVHMVVMRLDVLDNTDNVVTQDLGTCSGATAQSRDALTILKTVIVPLARLDYALAPQQSYGAASSAVEEGRRVAPSTLQLLLFCRLRAAGLAGRFVSAITTPLTSQHLDVVEVKMGGRWILLDPVLGGVVQNADGMLLGAADVHHALYDGSFRNISFHSFAPDAGVREASGNDQLYKFHYNVIITRLFGLRLPQLLPPFRFLNGPSGAIDRHLLDGHNEDITLQRLLYMAVTLVMPLAGLVSLAAGLLCAARACKGRGHDA